jgi:hypothetical protein
MKARLLKITIAIRTLLDVSKMSVVDLIKRLKEAEEAFRGAAGIDAARGQAVFDGGRVGCSVEEARGQQQLRRWFQFRWIL